MLDTNIIIYLLKGYHKQIAERIRLLEDKDKLVMSFVTYAELLYGAKKSSQPSVNLTRIEELKSIIQVAYNVNFSLCDYYAEWFFKLKKQGILIGNNDLWIASHALSEKAVLVTNNTQEFERITALTIDNWTT
ncbi:PIN domain-containing protein [Pelistega suis]|uniref:PIN domain-containing protein n=1 Tax=Pelistega suis TaxID=1631957 RepID=UPI00211BCBAE|nr:PIN domain-containing protein [Pelistega suis]MCQ9329041.1 PIN domain-containing protein [Pelistega suis]